MNINILDNMKPELDEEYHEGRWHSEETDDHGPYHPERVSKDSDDEFVLENIQLLSLESCDSEYMNDELEFDGFAMDSSGKGMDVVHHRRKARRKEHNHDLEGSDDDWCSCGTVDSLELTKKRLPHLIHKDEERNKEMAAKRRRELRKKRGRREPRKRSVTGADSLKLAHKRFDEHERLAHAKDDMEATPGLSFKLLRTKDSMELNRKRLGVTKPRRIPRRRPDKREIATKIETISSPEEFVAVQNLVSTLKQLSDKMSPKRPVISPHHSSSFHRQVLRHRSSSSLHEMITGAKPQRRGGRT